MSVVRIAFAALIAAGIAQPVLAGSELTSPDDSKSTELNNVTLDKLACEFQQHITFRGAGATASINREPRLLEPLRCSPH